MTSYSFLSDEWSFRLLEIISRTSIDYMEAMMQRKLAPDLQSSWAKNDLKSFPHIFRFRGVIKKISYVWWGYSSPSVSLRFFGEMIFAWIRHATKNISISGLWTSCATSGNASPDRDPLCFWWYIWDRRKTQQTTSNCLRWGPSHGMWYSDTVHLWKRYM